MTPMQLAAMAMSQSVTETGPRLKARRREAISSGRVAAGFTVRFSFSLVSRKGAPNDMAKAKSAAKKPAKKAAAKKPAKKAKKK